MTMEDETRDLTENDGTSKSEPDETLPNDDDRIARNDGAVTVVHVVRCGCLLYGFQSFQSAILPQFLSIYFQEKGLNGSEVGWLSSIMPLSLFFAGPLWSTALTNMHEKSSASTERSVPNVNPSKSTITQTTKTKISKTSTSSSTSFAVLYCTMVLSSLSEIVLMSCSSFSSIAAARLLYGVSNAPIKPLLDSIVLDGLSSSSSLRHARGGINEQSSTKSTNVRQLFGRIRVFGIIGSGLGTKFGGYVLERYDAPFLFLIQSICIVPVLSILWLFHESVWKPSDKMIIKEEEEGEREDRRDSSNESTNSTYDNNLVSLIGTIYSDMDQLVFFITVFVMGISAGANDAFTYVRFREVGYSINDMGMTRLISSLAGGIMFFFAGDLNGRLGMKGSMIVSVLVGCVRLMLVSSMQNPFFGYVAEVLRGGIYGIFWSTCTLYAGSIGPSSSRPVMLLLLNGSYNGIGRSSGAIIGGKIQTLVGTKSLFIFFAIVNAILASLLMLYYYLIPSKSWPDAASTVTPKLKKT